MFLYPLSKYLVIELMNFLPTSHGTDILLKPVHRGPEEGPRKYKEV